MELEFIAFNNMEEVENFGERNISKVIALAVFRQLNSRQCYSGNTRCSQGKFAKRDGYSCERNRRKFIKIK